MRLFAVALTALLMVPTSGASVSEKHALPHPSVKTIERAEDLLEAASRESAILAAEVDRLDALVRDARVSWQTHLAALDGVRASVRNIERLYDRLDTMRDRMLPPQEARLDRIGSSLALVAGRMHRAYAQIEDLKRKPAPLAHEYLSEIRSMAQSTRDLRWAVRTDAPA